MVARLISYKCVPVWHSEPEVGCVLVDLDSGLQVEPGQIQFGGRTFKRTAFTTNRSPLINSFDWVIETSSIETC